MPVTGSVKLVVRHDVAVWDPQPELNDPHATSFKDP